jgi:hypothetical protein
MALAHPFLVLQDLQSLRIISELHGTWSAKNTNDQPKASKTLELRIAQEGRGEESIALCQAFAKSYPDIFPVNRMCTLSGNNQFKLAVRQTVLLENLSEPILQVWNRLSCLSKDIDSLKLPYMRYAPKSLVNCQKTMKALIKGSGLADTDSLQLTLGDSGWSRFKCEDFYLS